MTPARLDEIRALAAEDPERDAAVAEIWHALRDLLEAHDGLRSRVLGLATELETEAPRGVLLHRDWMVERVRRCL